MMHEELKLFKLDTTPLNNAIATFTSFVSAGFIPLIPYIFGIPGSFYTSAVIGGLTLFIAGALRRFFLVRSWVYLGLEMFFVGGFAAIIAYAVGVILKSIFGL